MSESNSIRMGEKEALAQLLEQYKERVSEWMRVHPDRDKLPVILESSGKWRWMNREERRKHKLKFI